MSRPAAIWEGKLHVAGVTLRCYLLDDGRRVIDADDTHALMRVLASPQHPDLNDQEMIDIVGFLTGETLPTSERG